MIYFFKITVTDAFMYFKAITYVERVKYFKHYELK